MSIPFDPHPLFQDYAHPERLVSASWLSARLGTPGLRVVESDEDALLYDIGHLPGAVRIHWKRDLNSPLQRDFIQPEEFAKLMESKGIGPDDTVVIYGDKSNWWAAYTFWVFCLFGHKDVRLLNGGRDAWMAEERDTSFVVPEYPKTHYPVPTRNDAPHRVFVQEVLEAISTSSATLVDARNADDYAGIVPEDQPRLETLRHGHIPGAQNIPWDKSVYPNSRFRSFAELEQLYAEIPTSEETLVYCTFGHMAAHTWFVLKFLLGRDEVRNYDGSWTEWGNMIRMPIEQGTPAES